MNIEEQSLTLVILEHYLWGDKSLQWEVNGNGPFLPFDISFNASELWLVQLTLKVLSISLKIVVTLL